MLQTALKQKSVRFLMAFFRRTIWITERNDRLVFAQFLNFVSIFGGQTELISYQAINTMSVCLYSCLLLLLSVGLPVANAPDVLQPCGLLYYP